jgi:hypothetical protein
MSRHPHPVFLFARIVAQMIVFNPFNVYKAQARREGSIIGGHRRELAPAASPKEQVRNWRDCRWRGAACALQR